MLLAYADTDEQELDAALDALTEAEEALVLEKFSQDNARFQRKQQAYVAGNPFNQQQKVTKYVQYNSAHSPHVQCSIK